ncbi:hypothetical protein I4U23_005121 [Adineta vaga]|nr:hypothetical protein I4U23_005121 [Adineta vaga]
MINVQIINDQQSLQTLTTSQPIAQPYSDLIEKWICKNKSKLLCITLNMQLLNFQMEIL